MTRLALGLDERGVPVSVVVLFEEGGHAATLRAAGIPVTCLGFGRRSDAWRNITAFARLVRHLRRVRPAIVHAHLPPAYLLGVPAARLAGVPLCVASLHTLDAYLRRRPWLGPLDRRVLGSCDRLFAVSQAVERFAADRLAVPPGKVEVVYNGIPDSAFVSADPAPLDAPGPVLVSVGNLNAHKGHRHLLDAAALLRDRGRECTLVLVGDGAERDRLRAQADRLKLDVRLVGQRTDVTAWLTRADVVVMPSLTESMGIAVVEAMAAARPVVASHVGGLPELLRGRGVLVPPADPEALAEGIEWVLTHPAEARRLAGEALAWAGTHMRARAMVETYLAAYRGLAVS